MIPPIKRRGLMLVLSSPSGAGKTTLSRVILEKDPHISLSVSVTTRKQRPGEMEGEHYHFVSQEEFQEKIHNEDFLEYALVFGNYYGTLKKPVFEALESGKDILFDIDWQGTQQLSLVAKSDVVPVFVLPPSLKALEERLLSRAQDSIDVVKDRMSKALNEISHWPEYKYIIFNDNLERSLTQLESILRAERLKKDRLLGLADFVRTL